MSYDPPGLPEKPDDAALVGFASLMPEPEDRPGLLVRILLFPFKVLTLPFRVVARLFGSGRSADDES